MDDVSYDATAADARDDAPATSLDAAEPSAEVADVPANDSVPGLDEAGDAATSPQFAPAAADGATTATDAAGGADTPPDAADSTPPTDQPALGNTFLRPGGSDTIEVLPSPETQPITIELGHGPKPPEGWTPGGPERGG